MSKRKKVKNKTSTKKGSAVKKGNKSKKVSFKHNYTGKLSLIIPLYNEVGRLPLLSISLRKFEKQWTTPYEVIFVNDCSTDDTYNHLNELFADNEVSHVDYKIIQNKKNSGKGYALKQGVADSTGDHILTLDADMASEPSNLLNWLRKLDNNTFDDHTILIGSREHKDSNVELDGNKRKVLGRLFNFWIQLLSGIICKDTQCGFKLYPKAIGKWIFSVMKTKGWAHDVELLHRAKLYHIDFVEMPVNWKEVSESKISVWYDGLKMGLTSLGIVFQNIFKFFLLEPLSLLKKKDLHKIGGESPVYRFLFAILSLFLLFFMPIISFDYGITADEEVQYPYGKHILSYFESNGVDDSALNFKNLYLYGGIFDYSMAWMHKYIFNSWDVFEMRHMFNALVGAILMIFTGLLTQRVSRKWQAAFWALVFVFLSPRIFGHSMNNPKDIPFAAGYIISVYFLLGFIRALPRFSISSIAGFIIGVALTINIRVGGILLIPYLFLFTGCAFLLQKKLHIFLKKFGYLIKIALLLLVMSLLGYIGGTLYWPFAKEDWINGPLMALSEMSNFATGIRMVWEGQHYWSDFLPWYYILKWLSISTPLIILLGFPFVIYPIIKDNKNRLILLMVIFTGIFPLGYSIYKQSALYDGMRHFLFIYPI